MNDDYFESCINMLEDSVYKLEQKVEVLESEMKAISKDIHLLMSEKKQNE